MQNSYCSSSGTAPLSVSVDPGIKKSLFLNVGFACLHTLRPKHSCGGGCVSEDVDGYRFRRDLLLLRVRLLMLAKNSLLPWMVPSSLTRTS